MPIMTSLFSSSAPLVPPVILAAPRPAQDVQVSTDKGATAIAATTATAATAATAAAIDDDDLYTENRGIENDLEEHDLGNNGTGSHHESSDGFNGNGVSGTIYNEDDGDINIDLDLGIDDNQGNVNNEVHSWPLEDLLDKMQTRPCPIIRHPNG